MKNRRLKFESLESRTVLSTVAAELAPADVVDSDEAVVAFVLEVTDEAGQARSSFQTGERLYLNILVQDQRADARGVFAPALDLLYDFNLAVLNGEITFGSTFPNGLNATWDTPGVLDEVAAMGGMDTPGPGQMLFVRIPFVAVSPGSLAFTTNPADLLPKNDVLVHGWDCAVSTDQIAYGSIAIEITGLPVDGAIESPVVALPEPPVYPEDDPSHIVVPPGVPIEPPPAGQIEPPVVVVFQPVVIPEDELGEILKPPSDPVVPQPDTYDVWEPVVAVEQDLYRSDLLVRERLPLSHLVGVFETQYLLASMSLSAVADLSLASSDVSVMVVEPSTGVQWPFSPRDSDATPVLRQMELTHPNAEIPIGVAPARTVPATGSMHSARHCALGELLVNRLTVCESWDDGFLGRPGRIRQ